MTSGGSGTVVGCGAAPDASRIWPTTATLDTLVQ